MKFRILVKFKAKKYIYVDTKNIGEAKKEAEKELQNIKLKGLNWEYVAEEPKEEK